MADGLPVRLAAIKPDNMAIRFAVFKALRDGTWHTCRKMHDYFNRVAKPKEQ